MTRQEFIEDVNSICDLIEFCWSEDLDFCDDIYDASTMNDIIMERIKDAEDWTDVRDIVGDIRSGYDYYREDGYGNFYGADDDFDYLKQELLDYMDEADRWDEEDDEVEEQGCSSFDEDEEIEIDSFMDVLRNAG